MIDNLNSAHYTTFDIDTLNLNGTSTNWSTIVSGSTTIPTIQQVLNAGNTSTGQTLNMNGAGTTTAINGTDGSITQTDSTGYSLKNAPNTSYYTRPAGANPLQQLLIYDDAVTYTAGVNAGLLGTWVDIINSANAGTPTLNQVLTAGNQSENINMRITDSIATPTIFTTYDNGAISMVNVPSQVACDYQTQAIIFQDFNAGGNTTEVDNYFGRFTTQGGGDVATYGKKSFSVQDGTSGVTTSFLTDTLSVSGTNKASVNQSYMELLAPSTTQQLIFYGTGANGQQYHTNSADTYYFKYGTYAPYTSTNIFGYNSAGIDMATKTITNASQITSTSTDVGYSTTPQITINNTNATAGATTGVPSIETYKSGRNVAQSDYIFSQSSYAKSAVTSAKTEYSRITTQVTNTSVGGGDDGAIGFWCAVNGTTQQVMLLNGADNENNSFRPLDLNGNALKTSATNLTIDASSSSGTGQVIITPKVGSVIILNNLPTSAVGLPTGAIWKDTSLGNTLKVV